MNESQARARYEELKARKRYEELKAKNSEIPLPADKPTYQSAPEESFTQANAPILLGTAGSMLGTPLGPLGIATGATLGNLGGSAIQWAARKLQGEKVPEFFSTEHGKKVMNDLIAQYTGELVGAGAAKIAKPFARTAMNAFHPGSAEAVEYFLERGGQTLAAKGKDALASGQKLLEKIYEKKKAIQDWYDTGLSKDVLPKYSDRMLNTEPTILDIQARNARDFRRGGRFSTDEATKLIQIPPRLQSQVGDSQVGQRTMSTKKFKDVLDYYDELGREIKDASYQVPVGKPEPEGVGALKARRGVIKKLLHEESPEFAAIDKPYSKMWEDLGEVSSIENNPETIQGLFNKNKTLKRNSILDLAGKEESDKVLDIAAQRRLTRPMQIGHFAQKAAGMTLGAGLGALGGSSQGGSKEALAGALIGAGMFNPWSIRQAVAIGQKIPKSLIYRGFQIPTTAVTDAIIGE